MTSPPGAGASSGFDHDGTPIVAIGTATGHGSRTLIRASGSGCIEALADRLSGDAEEACRDRQSQQQAVVERQGTHFRPERSAS